MAEFYVSNRDIIKNFSINTGTSQAPTYTKLCTTSELTLNQSMESKDFYVFCDAIQRSVLTGVSMTLEGTIKIDINNVAIQNILGKVSTLITTGEISQFNNILVKFDLLTGVAGGVLTYSTYICNAKLELEGLGGSAENEGECAFTLTINGTGTLSA